jgi:hypothetical protein
MGSKDQQRCFNKNLTDRPTDLIMQAAEQDEARIIGAANGALLASMYEVHQHRQSLASRAAASISHEVGAIGNTIKHGFHNVSKALGQEHSIDQEDKGLLRITGYLTPEK